MQPPRTPYRARLAALAAAVLSIAGLQLVTAPDAHAPPGRHPDPGDQRLPRPDPERHDPASAGAAVLAGAVKQLRTANPNTVFAAAGDLIGASTFESFIAKDKPTIDALNEAGLEVSSVGNHEFDQGYNDLVNRVMAPYNATTNPYGGAAGSTSAPTCGSTATTQALDADLDQDHGRREGRLHRCGHRAPARAGLAGGHPDIKVTDIVAEANAAAERLKAEGADVVVLLVHEGPPAPTAPRWTPTRPRTSARSSPASTTTSTRSCRVTPTWPTTARSRCPAGTAAR